MCKWGKTVKDMEEISCVIRTETVLWTKHGDIAGTNILIRDLNDASNAVGLCRKKDLITC